MMKTTQDTHQKSLFGIREISLLLTSLALASWASHARADDLCSNARMDELRRSAQSLSPQTNKLATELSSCPAFRDEALLWASFYNQRTGNYDESIARAKQVGQLDNASERFRILSQANAGNYKALQALVSEKKAGWHDDAEALLVLARAQIRDGKYQEGRGTYSRYLELKSDDMDIRIESTYSYIWEEDWRTAEALFNSLLKSEPNDAQRTAIQRGLELTAKHRERELEREPHYNQPSIPLFYERYWSSYKSFNRQAMKSGYHSPKFHIDAAVISLSSDDPITGQTGSELSVSKNFQLGKSTELYTKIGGFQGTGNSALGAIVLTRSFANGLRPLVGFESEPVVKTAPIPTTYTSWNHQSVFAGINYKERFEYRFDSMSVTQNGNSSKHSANFQIPIMTRKEQRDVLKFKLLAETMAATEYSPYVYSPKESTVVLPGVVYEARLDQASIINVEFAYGSVSERLNSGAPAGSQNLAQNSSGQLVVFAGNYKTDIDEQLAAQVSFRYDRTSGPNETVTYQAGQIDFGILWYFDQPSKVEGSAK